MQLQTRAVVFSSVKYGEADLIVSCYTEKVGLKSYLLRGILKSKRGKLRASQFQLLTFLELQALHKDKGSLERIQEAKVWKPYQSLHTDVVKSSVTLFLAEVLKNSVKEEEANVPLFHFLEESLFALDTFESAPNFHLYFLLKLTEHLGFYPDFTDAEMPYFNLLEGNFQTGLFGDYCMDGEAVKALKLLDSITLETISNTTIPKDVRMTTLEMLLRYYQLHVQGFHQPKSLAVLTQLFH